MEDKNKTASSFDDLDLDSELEQDDYGYSLGDDLSPSSSEDDDDTLDSGLDDGLADDEDAEEADEDEDESDPGEESGFATISKSKLILINKLLKNIKENTEQVSNLLSGMMDEKSEFRIKIGQISESLPEETDDSDEKIIEGVFDGEKMIGPDGKQYSVPANYASKSKLVEGDMLKLTITPNGTFLYKQIGPIERRRISGELVKDDEGGFYVTHQGKRWKVLTASVTYFRGEAGDETIILVPKSDDSKWAAVENIIKNK